jgi:hypothetical protein
VLQQQETNFLLQENAKLMIALEFMDDIINIHQQEIGKLKSALELRNSILGEASPKVNESDNTQQQTPSQLSTPPISKHPPVPIQDLGISLQPNPCSPVSCLLRINL